MRKEQSIPFLKKVGWVAINALVALAFLASYVSAEQDSSPESLYKQAIEADDHGDVQKAIALYQELLKKQPASVEARTNLGVALAKTGRYDEATAQYREALKRDPKNPVVRLNLAFLRQPYWPLHVANELGVPVSWPAQYLRAAPDGTPAREGVSLPDFKRCRADQHGIPE